MQVEALANGIMFKDSQPNSYWLRLTYDDIEEKCGAASQ